MSRAKLGGFYGLGRGHDGRGRTVNSIPSATNINIALYFIKQIRQTKYSNNRYNKKTVLRATNFLTDKIYLASKNVKKTPKYVEKFEIFIFFNIETRLHRFNLQLAFKYIVSFNYKF